MERGRLLKKILDAAIGLELSLEELAAFESFFALQQGKGWGSATISDEVTACCSLLLEKPFLFVDIGGNRGAYSLELLRRFPEAQIHIFEPSSHNVTFLEALFVASPGVKVVGSALSDRPGCLTLYADKPGSGLGSLMKRRLDHYGIQMNSTEKVSVLRFDQYWETLSTAPPHHRLCKDRC